MHSIPHVREIFKAPRLGGGYDIEIVLSIEGVNEGPRLGAQTFDDIEIFPPIQESSQRRSPIEVKTFDEINIFSFGT